MQSAAESSAADFLHVSDPFEQYDMGKNGLAERGW